MDLGRQSPLGSACHPTAFCIKGDFLLCLFTPLNFFQVKPGEFFQVFAFLEGGEGAEPSPRSVLQPRGNTKISFTPTTSSGDFSFGGRPCCSAGPSSSGLGRHTLSGHWIWAIHHGRMLGAPSTSNTCSCATRPGTWG